MKIGIFDSGLGGLIVTQGILRALPQYDYLYLGDTARVPYGNRSQETIYEFTREAVDYLFRQDCRLIILACNTASAEALRKIQQQYLPAHYPERRVLGVLIPAAEEAVARTTSGRIGVLGTTSTVRSKAFVHETRKLKPDVEVVQQAAPLLVPLVENNGLKFAQPILAEYLAPLRAADIDCLVLGCTHYPYLQSLIQDYFGPTLPIIAQNEVVPPKLADYLRRHPETETRLSRNGLRRFEVTDLTEGAEVLARQLFGDAIALDRVAYLSEPPERCGPA